MEQRRTAREIADALQASGLILHQEGNQWRGQCPICGGSNKATKFALWDEHGFGHFHCHGCDDHEALVTELRQRGALPELKSRTPDKKRDYIETVYKYHDTQGRHVGGTVRKTFAGSGKKTFRQYHFNEDGNQVWKKFPGTPPLYNLHLITGQMHRIGNTDDQPLVIVCEGEKAADAVAAATGEVVTTSIMGSGKAHMSDWSVLVGWKIMIWPDQDTVGLKHAVQVRSLLLAAGALKSDITVLRPIGNAGSGDDAADMNNDAIRAYIDGKPVMPDTELPEVKPEKKKGKDFTKVTGRTHRNISTILSNLNIDVRFNSRLLRDEYQNGDGKWVPSSDGFTSHLRDKIGEAGYMIISKLGVPERWSMSKDAWYDAISGISYTKQVDPFVEWLEGLPNWDGIERITCLFGGMNWTVQSTQNPIIIDWAQTTVFLTAIQRAYEPGAFVKEHMILTGKQNAGKSTLFRELSPPFPWAFTDSIRMDISEQKMLEAIMGKVIVEFPEMVGRKRADIAQIKAFLTRQDDGTSTRLAYRRDPVSMPRTCAIVFTTNDILPVPNDLTGASRFVPIKLSDDSIMPIEKLKYLRENREQIWAEAFSLYLDGWRGNLPEEVKPEAAVMAEAFRDKDPVEYRARREFSDTMLVQSYTFEEVCYRLGLTDRENQTPDSYQTHRAEAAMLSVDWGLDGRGNWVNPKATKPLDFG